MRVSIGLSARLITLPFVPVTTLTPSDILKNGPSVPAVAAALFASFKNERARGKPMCSTFDVQRSLTQA